VSTALGAVLVPGVLPGERVHVGALRRGGGALRGQVLRIDVASADRVEPVCALADRCGGCPLMPLRLEAQRRLKERWVARALALPAPMIQAGEGLGYRRQARLHFQGDDRGLRLGYRGWRSRALVDVPACPVLAPALGAVLGPLREALVHMRGDGEVRLSSEGEGGVTVAVEASGPQGPEAYAALEALCGQEGVSATALRVGPSTGWARWGRCPDGPPGALHAPLAAFMQANAEVNGALIDQVITLAAPTGARILELYAGHGNLTVHLAAKAASLVAVERDPEAAEACRHNLRDRGLLSPEGPARVIAADAAAHASGRPVDTVVIDPPRTGARGVLGAVAKRRPGSIVYISCDMATLGRDVGELRAAGYRPDEARAFDMFPHTAHVEAVVRLVPAGRELPRGQR